ncbi:MAG: hypothetical protein HUK25_02525 [Treponema sp.]|nr:hypothetical protein [Treponema sp.]
MTRKEMTDGYVEILEKQIPKIEKKELQEMCSFLDSYADKNLPVLFSDGKNHLVFKYLDGRTEEITESKVSLILFFSEFVRTGTISLKDGEA